MVGSSGFRATNFRYYNRHLLMWLCIHISTNTNMIPVENKRDNERERESDVFALIAVQTTEDRKCFLSDLGRSVYISIRAFEITYKF